MKRHGGKLLIECLVALGAKKSFGIPGESYLAALDGLHDVRGTLDFVLCRNEGGAAFMAAAYGKLTGDPGIAFVTRGPGATNASIGVHTARQDSSPMLLFVGQVGTDMKEREAFQEVDYKAVFGTMAKWAVEIDRVERIPELVARAWNVATTGRPGPVVVALPEDMLSSATDVQALTGPAPIQESSASPRSYEEVKSLLERSSRPLIMIGGSNWTEQGSRDLQAFAETSDIPVIASFRYQDQFDNHSPVYCGEAGVGLTPNVRRIMSEADTILVINAVLSEMATDGYTLLEPPVARQKLIHVHSTDLELGKVYQPALGIISGPNSFVAGLAPVEGEWQNWRRLGREGYEAGFAPPEQPSPVDMGKVTAWLRENLPEDVIITNGAGNFTIWPGRFLKYGPKARLLAPQSGAMGYGLPAAISAKTTYPERMVVCFAGDGDFQMNCQELATALQHKAQPIILLLNNGIYGTIRAHQERQYPGRVSGTTMENPDFAALAKSYGFHAERIESTGAFADAFERARASTTGALLELVISPEAITPAQTLSQMRDAALSKGDKA